MISAVLPDLTSPPPNRSSATTQNTAAVQEESGVPTVPSSTSITSYSSSSKLAGIVGLFSGLGALLALTIFLPLPTLLDPTRRSHPDLDHDPGDSPGTTGTGQGLKRAYWIVSAYAIICGVACLIGLPHGTGGPGNGNGDIKSRIYIGEEIHALWRKIRHGTTVRDGTDAGSTSGEEERLLGTRSPPQGRTTAPKARKMFARAVHLGVTRWRTIGISYIGGFIAR